MAMNDHDHQNWHQQAERARKDHINRLRANDQIGPETRFPCLLAPGDGIAVSRMGPKGMTSTYVSVLMSQHGEQALVALTPMSARRLAATLMNIADEIDPYAPDVEFEIVDEEDES